MTADILPFVPRASRPVVPEADPFDSFSPEDLAMLSAIPETWFARRWRKLGPKRLRLGLRPEVVRALDAEFRYGNVIPIVDRKEQR